MSLFGFVSMIAGRTEDAWAAVEQEVASRECILRMWHKNIGHGTRQNEQMCEMCEVEPNECVLQERLKLVNRSLQTLLAMLEKG